VIDPSPWEWVGISCGFHDAAMALVNGHGDILWAAHSERYSGTKHDSRLDPLMVMDCIEHSNTDQFNINYSERPLVRAMRQIRQGSQPGPLTARAAIGNSIHRMLNSGPITTHRHHLCHAAGGFQTSPFDVATVVVVDSIGEWDTTTIWHAWYDDDGKARYKLKWRQTYPDSIGLFYSAWTERCGLQPLDEEYILMGMSAWGKPTYVDAILRDQVSSIDVGEFTLNLHTGIDHNYLGTASDVDLAASAQMIVEVLLDRVWDRAKQLDTTGNLVYSGGVALNCVANARIGNHWDRTWIMPNPGDAGNALGAAALGYGRRLNWRGGMLGYNITGEYPVAPVLRALLDRRIAGVANGRAEWGPRALGNRSLLADPRGQTIKAEVNEIKKRQQFRPFAPAILEEHVHDYFIMPPGWSDSRYMQVVAQCRKPHEYPAIVHVDGSSRVQTVPRDGSGFRRLLEAWYKETGCPMLLNTSLNIRGRPMVNNTDDARNWSKHYGVPVYTGI